MGRLSLPFSFAFDYHLDMKAFFSRYRWYQWLIFVIAIAVNVFIIVNACLSGNKSTEASGWLVTFLKTIINGIKANAINDENIGEFTKLIRKLIGHFSLFVLSRIFTTLSIKYLYFNKKHNFMFFIIIAGISGLFLATLTEFIQRFIPGRSGELLDILIDFAGYSLPLSILGIIIYFQHQKISNIENKE